MELRTRRGDVPRTSRLAVRLQHASSMTTNWLGWVTAGDDTDERKVPKPGAEASRSCDGKHGEVEQTTGLKFNGEEA